MKILLTGGGSAGHFYPLIAIVEEFQKIAEEEHLLRPKFFYMSTSPYDERALFDNDIVFKKIFAGKSRQYFSILNFFDIFKMVIGILKAFVNVFLIYPDVVVSKGGYASIPAVFSARVLRIPIIIHESDASPGRANLWAGKFAERIAVSWPEAAKAFPQEKTAVTGQPVRREIQNISKKGAHEYLNLEEGIPTILILGGSQGSKKINDTILEILPSLVSKYQIIHQTGISNHSEIERLAGVILNKNPNKGRYKPFGYLNALAMKMSAGVSSLVVTRAGSTIFEVAVWGLPSIVIPLSKSNGDHQRKNAYSFARSGASIVVEEKNLTPHVLFSEIDRLMDNVTMRTEMGKSAKSFFRKGASEKIVREIIRIGLEHEK